MTQTQLAHVWAHQTKPSGRASALSFYGPVIRSYSTAIGRILAPGVYLVNVAVFSVTTTAKHQNPMRRAIPHNATTLYYEDDRRGTDLNPSGADVVGWNIAQIQPCLDKAARARRYAPLHHEQARQWVERARAAARFYGITLSADFDTNAASIEAAAESVREQAEAQEREAEARREAAMVERWAEWSTGAAVPPPQFSRARFRVVGDTVESTMGAIVPLADFSRAVRFALSRREKPWRANGETFAVGNYSIQSIGPDGVIAGCHRVDWSEIDRLATLL